jgi:hypothetical protein
VTLARVPLYGPTSGDVTFTAPLARGWSDAGGVVSSLTGLMPTGTLQGEHVLAAWRLVDNGGPYVYLEAIAVELAPHPEVKGVADLANLKLRFLRNDSDGLQAGGLQPTTVAGQPAVVADSVAARKFPTGPGASGSLSSSDLNAFVTQRVPDNPVSELDWSARDVVVIRGSWGYDFRLFSTSPGAQGARQGDLNQLLAGLTFNY